jgi:MFS family permease
MPEELVNVTPAQPPPANDETATRSGSPLDLLNGAVGGAVLLVLAFWIVVILLPEHALTSWPWPLWMIALLLGFLVLASLAVTILALFKRQGMPAEMDFRAAIALFGYFLLLEFLIVGTSTGFISMTPVARFALAIGGTALASFVLGLLLFDTVRAAASVPIVVLFIGTATFPAPLPELSAIRPSLITWMGIIIGAAAVTEGANQIAGTIQRAQVAKAIMGATTGDTARNAPEAVQHSISEIARMAPGDLQRSRDIRQ